MSKSDVLNSRWPLTQIDACRRYAAYWLPGICFCLVVVLAAGYVSEHYGGSQIFCTLLLGMALYNISSYDEFAPGLEFCAKKVLRFGIALLGVRITFSQISDLGLTPYMIAAVVVSSTLVFGVILAVFLKVDRVRGIISAAAVGICGVSAALAVAAVLNSNRESEKHLLCTVVGVTGLSTLCMIIYPGVVTTLGLSSEQMGLFLGASIHDVAQVFGAGEMISPEVAELATYTKMLRVALLVPVIMILALIFRNPGNGESQIKRALPPFLIAFLFFVMIANINIIPAKTLSVINDTSQLCLCVAIAALGAKTNLLEMWKVGKKPLLLLVCNTLFIAGVSLLLVL